MARGALVAPAQQPLPGFGHHRAESRGYLPPDCQAHTGNTGVILASAQIKRPSPGCASRKRRVTPWRDRKTRQRAVQRVHQGLPGSAGCWHR
jgi:hypothetical protein